MRLNRRQRRILKRKLKTFAVNAACTLGVVAVFGGLFIAWASEPMPDWSSYIEENHIGMVEVSDGVWLTNEEYEQMDKERQAYQESEAAEEQEFYNAVFNAGIERTEHVITCTSVETTDYDTEDAYRLCKIAMAEAEGEDTEGKALVMLVVLNRVSSDEFPDSIEEVITQEGQFTAYSNGRYDRVEPSEDCWAALRLIQEEGWNESCGATYFERTTDGKTWHNTSLKTLFTHGNHTFYIEEEGETK